MMRTIVLAAVLMGCGSPPGPSTQSSPTKGTIGVQRTDVTNSIGTVGGAPLGEDALLYVATGKRPADGKAHTEEERAAIVEELVTEELLFQKAISEGLYHDPKVRKILTNLLLRKEVYGNVSNADFSETELRAYYDAHKEQFVVPEKVQAKRIVISKGGDAAKATAEANTIYNKLKSDPTAFSALAMESSDGPYKRRGGDLGFVSREGKPGVEPEVVAKAFEMKVNELSKPFEVGNALHILLVINRRDRVERSFEQMKGSVLRMVKQEKFEELRKAFIEKARAETEIVLDEEKIKGIDLTKRTSRFGPGPTPRGPKGGQGGHGKDDGHNH